MRPIKIGIPWYTEATYRRVLEVMDDRHLFSPTYAGWLQRAGEKVAEIQHQGAIPIRVRIDPTTFPAWCRERGLAVDAHARMEFASFHAAHQDRDVM